MKAAKRNLVITVLGRKGSGKTTLVKKLLTEFARVVIVDTNREYTDEVAVVVSKLDDALAYLEDVAKRPKDEAFSVAYIPAEIPEDALDFLKVVFTLENVLVVVDEAHMYCSAHTAPQEILKLVRLGRHRELSQVYVSQRPSTIPRDVTAQSDLIVSFQQHEGRDIEYMARLYGREADSLKRLKPYTVEVFGTDQAMETLPVSIEKARGKKGVDGQLSLL